MPHECRELGDTLVRGGTARDTGTAFPQVSGMFWGRLGRGGMSSSGLITRRSQVQILPPLPTETPENRVFSGVSRVSGVVRFEVRGHNAVISLVSPVRSR